MKATQNVVQNYHKVATDKSTTTYVAVNIFEYSFVASSSVIDEVNRSRACKCRKTYKSLMLKQERTQSIH